MRDLIVVLASLALFAASASAGPDGDPASQWFQHVSEQQPVNGQKKFLAAVLTQGHRPADSHAFSTTCAVGRVVNGSFIRLYDGRVAGFFGEFGSASSARMPAQATLPGPSRACYLSFPKRLKLVRERLFVQFTVESAGAAIAKGPLRLRPVVRHCC